MRILTFNVHGQKLEKDPTCDFDNIVAGSKNYLKAYFNLPEDWQNCVVAASFWRGKEENAMILENNMCEIPDEMIDYPTFRVSLTCKKNQQLIPTNKVLVRQEVRR